MRSKKASPFEGPHRCRRYEDHQREFTCRKPIVGSRGTKRHERVHRDAFVVVSSNAVRGGSIEITSEFVPSLKALSFHRATAARTSSCIGAINMSESPGPRDLPKPRKSMPTPDSLLLPGIAPVVASSLW